MKFHITLNDEDFFAFNVCHCLSIPTNKHNFVVSWVKSFMISFITSLVISLIITMMLFFLFEELDELFFLFELLYEVRFNFLVVVLTIVSIYAVLIFVYNIISYPKIVRKNTINYIEELKKAGKLPYDAESTVEFLEEEIRTTNLYGFQRRKYSDVTHLLRDEEHIYIILGAAEASILPLRCLEGRENELVEFLKGKLQKNGPQPDRQV